MNKFKIKLIKQTYQHKLDKLNDNSMGDLATWGVTLDEYDQSMVGVQLDGSSYITNSSIFSPINSITVSLDDLTNTESEKVQQLEQKVEDLEKRIMDLESK